MTAQITATLPALDFPLEADYPTQNDWAAFNAAAELNFGILGGEWSSQMQLWKTEANSMSVELNNNADIAQSIANYQGDWTSRGYTLGQSVSVSGVFYICKLTHAAGQNPADSGSIYWNLALGNWNLKVDKVTSINNAVARFNGTTGDIQSSGIIIDDNNTFIIPMKDNTATFGTELTTNGTFTGSSTGWTLGTNWAYSANSVVCTLNASAEGTLSQNVSVVQDKLYMLTWSQTNSIDTNGQITPSLGAVIGGKHSLGNTTQTFSQTFRASATGSVALTFTVNDITSTGTITLDSISLAEVIPITPSIIMNNTENSPEKLEFRTTKVTGSIHPNIGIGNRALASNTTGYRNLGIGGWALASNTTGDNNTANGVHALQNNTTGYGNTASGAFALASNTTGNNNTASGWWALASNTTGYNNTASGVGALQNNTTGDNNTANGVHALQNNTTGYGNTASGVNALSSNTVFSNVTGLGNNSQVTGSNQVQLGDSGTTTYVYGTVQNRSDARDKADIRDTVLGLDFIKSLRPVDYKWDMREDYKPERPNIKMPETSDENYEELKAEYERIIAEWLEACKHENIKRDGSKKRSRYHQGFIAQEIQALNVDFGGLQDHSIKGGYDVLSIGYDEIIAPLVKAVQEQQAMIDALKTEISMLKGAN